MEIDKPYYMNKKCEKCKFCVSDKAYGWMDICLIHNIDVSMFDLDECDDFEEGYTSSQTFKLEHVYRQLNNLIEYSACFNKNIEATFLFNQIKKLANDKDIFGGRQND